MLAIDEQRNLDTMNSLTCVLEITEPHSGHPLTTRAWLRCHRQSIFFWFSRPSRSSSVAGRHIFQQPCHFLLALCSATTLRFDPLLPELKATRCQHVRKRRRWFVPIPRPMPFGLRTILACLHIPTHHQCPHKPRHRCRPLHRRRTPHLRVLKAEHLLGIAERHLDTPPPAVARY